MAYNRQAILQYRTNQDFKRSGPARLGSGLNLPLAQP